MKPRTFYSVYFTLLTTSDIFNTPKTELYTMLPYKRFKNLYIFAKAKLLKSNSVACVLAESDNESVPPTPFKNTKSTVSVKTLEQIKLDKIQEESAAYYSYTEMLRPPEKQDLPFKVLSLEEIRKTKEERQLQPDSTTSRREEKPDEPRSKPIRLKRCLVRGNEENMSRVKLKRPKLLESQTVSSTNEPVEGMDFIDKPLTSEMEEETCHKIPDDDLLKDIDALLGD